MRGFVSSRWRIYGVSASTPFRVAGLVDRGRLRGRQFVTEALGREDVGKVHGR